MGYQTVTDLNGKIVLPPSLKPVDSAGKPIHTVFKSARFRRPSYA